MRGRAREAVAGAVCCTLSVLALFGTTGCAGIKEKSPAKEERTAATNRVASSVSPRADERAGSQPSAAKAPDDTAQNRRDADADTLTPLDQGNSALDRRITQRLRRAILAGEGGRKFSFSAKNIKIITINGEVTLRGVVGTSAEKSAIEDLAKRIAGVQKVNNQLATQQRSGGQTSSR